MSVSLWRWTEECDGRFCVGDCDLCTCEEEDEDVCDLQREIQQRDQL